MNEHLMDIANEFVGIMYDDLNTLEIRICKILIYANYLKLVQTSTGSVIALV